MPNARKATSVRPDGASPTNLRPIEITLIHDCGGAGLRL